MFSTKKDGIEALNNSDYYCCFNGVKSVIFMVFGSYFKLFRDNT